MGDTFTLYESHFLEIVYMYKIYMPKSFIYVLDFSDICGLIDVCHISGDCNTNLGKSCTNLTNNDTI